MVAPPRFGGGERRVEIGDTERGHDPRRARQQRHMQMLERGFIVLGEPAVLGERERYAELIAVEGEQVSGLLAVDDETGEGMGRHGFQLRRF